MFGVLVLAFGRRVGGPTHTGALPYSPQHDVDFIFVEVRQHPYFSAWLVKLAGTAQLEDVFGEVMALINALETHGRELAGEESHPVFSSHYDLHALRRNPPTPHQQHPGYKPITKSGGPR